MRIHDSYSNHRGRPIWVWWCSRCICGIRVSSWWYLLNNQHLSKHEVILIGGEKMLNLQESNSIKSMSLICSFLAFFCGAIGVTIIYMIMEKTKQCFPISSGYEVLAGILFGICFMLLVVLMICLHKLVEDKTVGE